MITLKRCTIRKSKRDLEYSPNIPRWLDRLSGTVSRRGNQTLILKGRVKFTINSFNLQCFSPQLSLWKTMMILTRQPTQTVTLIMLVFVISGTRGYRLGLEIINATSCGKLLFSNLTLKNSLGKITECYQKWHGKWKLGIPLRKKELSNFFLTTDLLLSQCPKVRTLSQLPTTRVRFFAFGIFLFVISTVMKRFYAQNWHLSCIICLVIYQASWYFATDRVDVKNVAGMFQSPSGFRPL